MKIKTKKNVYIILIGRYIINFLVFLTILVLFPVLLRQWRGKPRILPLYCDPINLLFFGIFFFELKKNPEKFVLIAGEPRVYLWFNCRESTIISLASKSKKNSPEGCTYHFSFVYYCLRNVVFLARSPLHLAIVIVYRGTRESWIFRLQMWSVCSVWTAFLNRFLTTEINHNPRAEYKWTR